MIGRKTAFVCRFIRCVSFEVSKMPGQQSQFASFHTSLFSGTNFYTLLHSEYLVIFPKIYSPAFKSCLSSSLTPLRFKRLLEPKQELFPNRTLERRHSSPIFSAQLIRRRRNPGYSIHFLDIRAKV